MKRKIIFILTISMVFNISFSQNYAEENINTDFESTYAANIMGNYSNFRNLNGVKFNFNKPNAKLELYFQQDYSHDHPFLGPWGNIIFEGYDSNQQNHVLMTTKDPSLVNPATKDYRGKDITLKNTFLEIGDLNLLLGYSGTSTLSLDNATFFGNLGVAIDQNFIIESVANKNTLMFLGDIDAKSTVINIRPNSTLVFGTSTKFRSPTTINIDRGELVVGDSQNIDLDVDDAGSSLNINNGKLTLAMSATTLNARNLNSINSEIYLNNNTNLNLVGDNKFNNTLVTLNNGASFTSSSLILSGYNKIIGSSAQDVDIAVNVVNGTLDYQAVGTKGKNKFGNFFLENGTLILGKNIDIEADFNVESNSKIIGDYNIVDGYAFFTKESMVSGTIHFNDFVTFIDDKSYYQTTLHPNAIVDIPNEVNTSEVLSSDVSINGLDNIVVEGDSVNAKDYENKKFLVAKAPTITGNKSITHGSSLPALLDFDVIDDGATTGQNVTLVGKIKSTSSLANHSGITSGGSNQNAQQVVNILPPTNSGGTPPVLSPGAQKLQSALLTMTNAQVSQNLNSLHAEPYSSHLTIGLEQNDLFLNMVMNHAAPRGDVYHNKAEKSSREVVPETQNNIWVDTAYVSGDVDGEDGLGDFSYRLTNVIVGGDVYEKGYLTLGIYGGYGYHKMDEHDSVTQEFETDTYHIGTYGSYRYDNWVFTGMFGYAYGRNETEREVTVGTSSGKSGDKFDSHSFYTGFRGAYPIKVTKNTTLTPNAGISYSYIYQEEVKESGFDMADLVVDSADADSFITSVGLHIEYENAIGATPIRPMAFIRYEHDWSANNDSSHEVDAAFRHTPDAKTTFSGQNRGENLVLVGAGMEVEVTPYLLVGGGVSYSDDSNGKEKAIGFNFEYLWE